MIEVDPKFSMAHNLMGLALENNNKLEEAIECYKTSISLDPNLSFLYNNLGIAYYKTGKKT